jgi:hypothetical protein
VQYNNGILLNDLKNEFSSQEKMWKNLSVFWVTYL